MFASRNLRPLQLGNLVRRQARTRRYAVQPRTNQQDDDPKTMDWYEKHGVPLNKQRLNELNNQIWREEAEAERRENDKPSDSQYWDDEKSNTDFYY